MTLRLRRSFAVALAAALVWVTPVLDDDPGEAPEAVTGTVQVTDWTGGGPTARNDAGLWTVSAPVPAGDTVLVGADWGGDHDVAVEVRAAQDGTWSEWYRFDGHDEHAPDPDTDEAARAREHLSEPVWLGESDQLQFRSSQPLPSLEVATVAMVGGDGLDWTPDDRDAGAVLAATTRPTIRSRASWGADESLKNDDPAVHQDVRFGIIHHIGGGNWGPGEIEAGCREADDKIRSIYAFHTNSRGYDDIAYNFVVDPCGNVWEGRSGGIENAVQGAHASGFNQGSVGVLALGTFSGGSSDPVTEDLVDGIERLLAWKFDLHHVDPDGVSTEIAGGGGSSRYRDGELVDVPVISAHQVQNSTSCPGEVLMSALFDGQNQEGTPKPNFVDAVRTRGLPKAFGGPSAEWSPGDNQDGNDNVDPLDDELPVWDVTFSTPMDWRLEITDEDGDVVRATGGADERRADRTWDLRNEAGEPVTAGIYTATLTAVDADGDEISPVVSELDVRSPIGRIAGDTRVTTAVELSQEAFEEADVVVLASSQAYPDALVASPLAASLDAPVLLTPRDELDTAVAEEIERLGATEVRVIGGTVAVSSDVTDELVGEGLDVVRHAGRTRFETAAVVAEQVLGDQEGGEVLVALGNHPDPSRAFPDALAAGAYGAIVGSPVLLVEPDGLPADTSAALRALQPAELQLFGGTLAIDTTVERAVERAAGVSDAARFAGEDRFDTAAIAATELLSRRPGTVEDPTPGNVSRASEEPTDGSEEPTDGATDGSEEPTDGPTEEPTEPDEDEERRPRPIMLASGRNWPDALGAGAAIAALQGLFVLVDDDDLEDSSATATFLEDNADIVERLLVAGGPVAVDSDVVLALEDLELGDRIQVGEPIDWDPDPNEPAQGASEEPEEETDGPVLPFPSSSEEPSPDPTASESPSPSPSPDPSDTETESDPVALPTDP